MSAKPNYIAKSPYCEHQLDPATAVDGWVTCECGRKSDAKWVNELGWLQARETWVAERIANAEPWFDSHRAAAKVRDPQAGQRVLYTLGGLSMIVAVAVFTAVAWERIGAIGQGLTLLGIMLVSAVLAVLARKKLTGLADTLAIISSAVLAVLLYTAPDSGLLPREWAGMDSWFAPTAALVVGGLSLIVGWKFRLVGWLSVVPVSVLVSAMQFDFGYLGDINSYYDWQRAFTVALFIGVVIVLDRFGAAAYGWNPEWRGLGVFNGAIAVFAALISLASLMPTITTSTSHSLQGGILVAAALISGVSARIFKPVPERSKFAAWTTYGLPFICAATTAAGLVMFTSFNNQSAFALWFGFGFGAVVGAAVFIPGFAELLHLPRRLADVFVIALWWFTFVANIERIFMSEYAAPRLPLYPITMFFAVIAAAGLVRWRITNNLIGFVIGAAAGCGAVITLVNEVFRDNIEGPEPVTLTTAAWLLVCMLALRARNPKINSSIWLGIPLAVALIPSAAAAVGMVYDNGELLGNWVRLWSVLGIGILGTVVGAQRRIAGVLWPSAVAYLMSTVPQIWIDLGLIVPRWVFFALLGVLLITLAARYERLAQLKKESGSWGGVFR